MVETSKPMGKPAGPTGSRPDYHEQQQQPADMTHQAQQDIERGPQANRDGRPEALEEAVEDLNNGLAVTPKT